MKKKWIKPLTLGILFVASLVFFSFITNQTNEDTTTDLAEASLPIVSFTYDEQEINPLHGYTTAMDASMMRDSITPVGDDRNLSLVIDTYDTTIEALSYEIRGLDGERLVADGSFDAGDILTYGSHATVDFQVQNLLEEDEEYLLILDLTVDGRDVYYYTRLMQTEDYDVDTCVEFAKQFHDATFTSEGTTFLPTYLDAATGDATTLNYVDLSCTLKQIMWNQFDCSELYDASVSLKEITSSYNVITMNYVVVHTNDSGEVEYYNVEEYYRLRNTTTRMYVLNFERTMDQIFLGDNTFVTDKSKIQLGIRDLDVEYLANENNDTVAFVQEGDLWRYSQTNNEMTRIFGFRGAEGIDARENWNQYSIRVLRVDEAGSVDFIAYGYMNRGDHEGQVGVAVYHYDGIGRMMEETAFIPMDCSYAILDAELGQLLYENEQSEVYMLLAGTIYRLDLNTLELETMEQNLKDGCYAVSESGQYVAWVEYSKMYSSSSLNLLDCKTGDITQVQETGSQYVLPLGFVQEDLVYGIARESDILTDGAGNISFPMYELKIVGLSGDEQEVLKTYQPENYFISGIKMKDYTVIVNLAQVENNGLVVKSSDSIMNREAEMESGILVTTTATDVKETQVQLKMTKEISTKKLRLSTCKSLLLEETPLVEWTQPDYRERYYVYAKGQVLLATDTLLDAIEMANDNLGVVINSSQTYVWKRARNNTQAAFKNLSPNEKDADASSIAKAISIMLQREGVDVNVNALMENRQTPKGILTQYLKDATVVDLHGCSVEEILYYISNGNPVFAMTGEDSAVLVIGYTGSTVTCYNPVTETANSLTWEKASELFAQGGNVFYSFID